MDPLTDLVPFRLEGGQTIFNVHDPSRCEGRPCPVHNPSDHHMRSWPQNWRSDRAIMERVCAHGVGHPDPDQNLGAAIDGLHGCDGCCTGTGGPQNGIYMAPAAPPIVLGDEPFERRIERAVEDATARLDLIELEWTKRAMDAEADAKRFREAIEMHKREIAGGGKTCAQADTALWEVLK